MAPLAPPYPDTSPAVAVWMIIGVIYLIVLYRRHPRRVTEVGLVHLDARGGDGPLASQGARCRPNPQ